MDSRQSQSGVFSGNNNVGNSKNNCLKFANGFSQNYIGQNSNGRGLSAEVAAAQDCLCQQCLGASMEEYSNLMRQCPAIQKLILEEMRYCKQQETKANAATSLHLSSSTRGTRHGFGNFNRPPRDGVRKNKTFDSGSKFRGNSLHYISQPSGNGIKLQKDNHGFLENQNKVDYSTSLAILDGDKSMLHPMMQISQEESERLSCSSDFVKAPVLTYGTSNSQIQNPVSEHIDKWTQQSSVPGDEKLHVCMGGSGEHRNQTAGQEEHKFPQHPEQINGVKHVSPEMWSSLKLIVRFYYSNRSKSVSMINSSISFLEYFHKTRCANRQQCNCRRIYNTLVLHFDKCKDSNCGICEPERSSASGKQKDDRAGALCNRESNGSIIDKSVDIIHPSICQKVITSVNQPHEVFNSLRKRSNHLAGIPCPLKNRKITPSVNQHLDVYRSPGKRKNDLEGVFVNSGSNGTVTEKSYDIMRASKCQKLENPIFSRVAPSIESAEHPRAVRTTRDEAVKSSNSEKSPGSHLDEDLERKHDQLAFASNSDRAVNSANVCDIIGNPENSDQNDISFPEEATGGVITNNICEPERSSASGKQKDDRAGALCNRESNGSVIDKSVDIIHPSVCQKVTTSVNQPHEVFNSLRKRSNHLAGIPRPLKNRKITPSVNQQLEVYRSPGKRKNDLEGVFVNSGSNGTVTEKSYDIMRASKCQKMENPIFSRVAPSIESAEHPREVRTTRDEAVKSSNSEKSPGSHLDEDLERKHDQLAFASNSDRAVNSANICDIIDNPENSDQNDISFPEEATGGVITNKVVAHQGSDSVPENSEKSSMDKRDEDLNQNHDRLASASTYDTKMKLECNKQRFSITDFFTAGEMKEYLRYLKRWSGQEVRENMNPSLDHNNNWLCQLCDMDMLVFAPAPMYCAGCKAPIKPDSTYYQPSKQSGPQNCFCTSCHRASFKNLTLSHGEHFVKANLEKKKNDERAEELWIQCDICEGMQHRICALYNKRIEPGEKEAYICPKCWLDEIETREHQPLPKAASFGAKDLPRSMLSDHIEKRLFKRLKKEREEIAKDPSKTLFEAPEEHFSVRVVLSADRKLEVKRNVLDIFNESNYPAEFPYRSKVVLLFQKIEGIDVCLFGMYVQEYGSNCDQPNQRCVYISYIDSVKYMRPNMKTATGEALRTLVYHEILIGYLDYCKKRGFTTCYIWACPPSKGEDYILYCHPESQKIPKADKLQHWYELMLKKAIKEDIAVSYTNLYDHFFLPSENCNTKITAARLPYFDGDYWSSTAETIIDTFEQDSGGALHLTKTSLKAMGHNALSSDTTKDVLLMQKLGQKILPEKKKFMIIHLQLSCIRCHEAILSGVRWSCNKCKKFNICLRCLNRQQNIDGKKMHVTNAGEKHLLSEVVVNDIPTDTEDNDIIQDNNIFNNRDTFLGVCHKNNYQFDTLRRAKYSSTMILCNLHNIISVDM